MPKHVSPAQNSNRACSSGARAVAHYERFLELWRGADPQLQPSVEEARRAIARLRVR